MGMRGLGQIENLSKFSEPDIAVITNIGTAHIGILGSKENITSAKCEITKHLNPNGVVIIPANQYFLEETLKKNWNGRIIKVELLDINQKAQNVNKNNLQGFFNQSNNSIIIEDKLFEISFKGFHNAFNFLFVYAVAKEFGIKFKDINKYNFYDEIYESKEMYNLLTEFYKYGFVIFKNVPTNDNFIVKFANSIGSVRRTNFGEHFNVKSVPNPNDLAYTSLPLAPHTDNPHYPCQYCRTQFFLVARLSCSLQLDECSWCSSS